MSVFESSYPPVPDSLMGKDYVITYHKDSDSYYIIPFKSKVTETDGSYYLGICNVDYYTCHSDSDSWNFEGHGIGTSRSHVVLSDNVNLVYSSYDILLSDGSIFYYSVSDTSGDTVSAVLSSSSIFHSLKSQIVPFLSLLCFAVLCFLGLRKAWNFFNSLMRGA